MAGFVTISPSSIAAHTTVDIAKVFLKEPGIFEGKHGSSSQQTPDPSEKIEESHDDPLHRLGCHLVGKFQS